MLGKVGNRNRVANRMRTTLNRTLIKLALFLNVRKKEDCWEVDYISLYFVTTIADGSFAVYWSHSYIKPFNLWPQIARPPLIQTGAGGRRGYSPGSAGRVWYDIPMLKLAVEVQDAGNGCLGGGYWPNIRSELGVRCSNRGLFLLVCWGCCEFS